MKVKINDIETNAVLTKDTNTPNDEAVAISLMIGGYFVLEITKTGKLRRCNAGCDKSNGLVSKSKFEKIELERGH